MARSMKGRSRPTASRGAARGTGKQAGAPSQPPVITPDVQARLPELLAAPTEADAAERFSTIAADTPGGPLALIEALGSSRSEAAGRVLAVVATTAPDKEQRKAARRALHRLRSVGIAVAVPAPVEPEPVSGTTQDAPRPIQALVSPSDGVGSRVLWLLLERPHGGLTLFNLAINDIVGLKDGIVEETTRRRLERRLEDWKEHADRPVVEIPVEYGLALLSEALALNTESQFPLPRDFVIRRGLLGELPPPPSDALIHQHISRGQTFLMPNLLDESAGLLEAEPELQGWIFAYDQVKPYAREYRQAGESMLLVSSEPREARQERILGNAIDALFTPEMRRGFRRRLEETAYIFWQTDRQRAARQAVAAAFAIGDTGSLRTHPLLREIVRLSIEMANEIDRSGMPPPPGANRTARTTI